MPADEQRLLPSHPKSRPVSPSVHRLQAQVCQDGVLLRLPRLLQQKFISQTGKPENGNGKDQGKKSQKDRRNTQKYRQSFKTKIHSFILLGRQSLTPSREEKLYILSKKNDLLLKNFQMRQPAMRRGLQWTIYLQFRSRTPQQRTESVEKWKAFRLRAVHMNWKRRAKVLLKDEIANRWIFTKKSFDFLQVCCKVRVFCETFTERSLQNVRFATTRPSGSRERKNWLRPFAYAFRKKRRITSAKAKKLAA